MYSTTRPLDLCQKKRKTKYDSFLLGMHFSVAVASVQQHVGHIKVRNFKLRRDSVKILEGEQIGNKTDLGGNIWH